MSIRYDEANRIFELDTRNTSYRIGIADEEGFVGHIYYGQKIRPQKCDQFLRTCEAPFVPSKNNRERCSFMDTFPTEYSGNGIGDYRESCIAVKTANGSRTVDLKFVDYDIVNGKPGISGLPASFAGEEEVQTLVVHMMDGGCGIDVDLIYSVFEDEDVITRSVSVKNAGDRDIRLTKVYSACIDMDDEDFEMLTLHGSWARERQIERRPIAYGKQSVSSLRGESSHQDHPFMAWMTKGTDQTTGDVYGMHFVYSGNFIAQIEKSQFDSIRAVMGIHSEGFEWWLTPGETFTAPEVVLTYSHDGLGQMTRNLHDFYRCHMIRSRYLHQKRPVLINNWEATYFDFDTDKLLAIAKSAAEHGIEMLVMDDGWFGHRNDDATSLGDWFVNENKIKGGLKHLVDEVNKLGLKFGIWMEPEMISPDSELYRKHPDWAFAVPERTATLSRNQYVLDLSRKEVRDYVYECVHNVISSANIEYVKWDMNRQLTDIGSVEFTEDRQGELAHRYVLGVYELQERLVNDFPDLLLENCSGGGARFDPGMLYYSPQIWCSDDTDAIERLSIQEGTELIYPLSTMGAHVSDCPNHTVGRSTPFMTRAHVALAGTFGYELDITKISEEERAMIPEQVSMYHKYNDLVREGDYYRVASYRENGLYDCWMVVAKDKSEALVTYVQVLGRPNVHSRKIKLLGLDVTAGYRLDGTEKVYGGDLLMNAGMLIETMRGDYMSRLYHFVLDNSLT
ncbi:alpha-galactosidase [Coprococcus sp. OM06-34AC]|jgi:alpha-galactosidase|uniref:alpha-galactosidase n=1 Tax=Coprococcus sp. OM06-34AC TaxID=2293095 RepID=UPI000E4CC3FE|nr:alpha-galactosidase [Coprococcus sp. OM06-34AC]RGI37323.1 alpha-galactosidase [Coprococcus sp. OM06-34AC]